MASHSRRVARRGLAAFLDSVQRGSVAGNNAVEDMINGQHHLLGWTVQDFVSSGKFGGYEIGFCGAISRRVANKKILTLQEIEALFADDNGADDADRYLRIIEARDNINTRAVCDEFARRHILADD